MLRPLTLSVLLLLATTAQAEPPSEKLVKFDYREAKLAWSYDHWQMRAGDVVLKDFGRRETDGRDVLRLVRELRLNQWGTIGSPRPVMEYWLTDGNAPRGPVFGVHPHPIDLSTIKAEQSQGMWMLRDATHPLFNFGYSEAEAKQALAVIQRYHFSQLGTVGRGIPTMMVFFGSPTEPSPAKIVNSPLPQSSRTLSLSPIPKESEAKPAPGKSEQPEKGFGRASLLTPVPLLREQQLSVPHYTINDTGSGAERTPFEWRQMQLKHDSRHWKLVSGPYTVADFGSNERDAQLAQAAVQFYRFTEDCKIGQSESRFRYFLTNGQAPRGLMVGIERVGFQPNELAVRQANGEWVISDGRQTLGRFGDRATEANQALADLRHYKFDTLCRIGHGDANGMTFFIRAR